jgi:zinc transport system substrate-binding protein
MRMTYLLLMVRAVSPRPSLTEQESSKDKAVTSGVGLSLPGDVSGEYTMRGVPMIGITVAYLWLVLGPGVSAAAGPRMVAIASIFPMTDVVQQVGGERWEVTTLIPAGASAHTYEPTPEQVRQLAQARVFFQIGLGLEFWLEKLVRATKNAELVRVDLSQAIETLPAPSPGLPSTSRKGTDHGRERLHHTSARGEHEHSHTHKGADVHYWLDPVRMQRVVTHVEQVFATLDPEHARPYAERAQRLRNELEKLHEEIVQDTQGLQNRGFVALHAAWTYFAPRYDLRQAAVIEPFPGREPSPRYLADLARLMRREKVNAIVIEPQLTATAAQALARETGARVGMLDPYGGPGVSGRESYLDLMRYNVAALAKLLR